METLKNKMVYSYLKNAYEKFDYKFFDNGEYNLNIFGIRSENQRANQFDDIIGYAYKDENDFKNVVLMKATTDPGSHWLKNPLNNRGCAILVPGQYRSSHKLGLHRNSYEALVQIGSEVSVYRDDNEDLMLDKDDLTIMTGYFGINVHRSHPSVEVTEVNKYSAGCQVVQSPKEYDKFIDVCHKSKNIWGNSFTYTLFNEKDIL